MRIAAENIRTVRSDESALCASWVISEGKFMPIVRHYTVTQVREMQVSANNEVQAAVLATKVFNGEEYAAEPGISVTKRVHVIELNVKQYS